MSAPRISVVIPALNEAARIEQTLVSTRAYFDSTGLPYELIVVDDGSTDATAAIASRNASVVKHERNLGKGAAVRSGALASAGEWMLFLDADLSTQPDAFSAFIPHLETQDVLFASRRTIASVIGSAQPAWRNGSGQIFNVLVRHISDLPYRDTQCGFKAFRMETCRPFFEALETTGWAFDVELLVRARKRGLKMLEIPVEWHHQGGSRVRLRHFPKVLKELALIRKIA